MCSLRFKEQRQTKNTILFEEIMDPGMKEPFAGSIYIKKWALKAMGYEAGSGRVINIDVNIEDPEKTEEIKAEPAKKTRKTRKKATE